MELIRAVVADLERLLVESRPARDHVLDLNCLSIAEPFETRRASAASRAGDVISSLLLVEIDPFLQVLIMTTMSAREAEVDETMWTHITDGTLH